MKSGCKGNLLLRSVELIQGLAARESIFDVMPGSRGISGPVAGPLTHRVAQGRALGIGLLALCACVAVLALLGAGPPGTPLGPAEAEARCGERLAARYQVQSRYPKLYASQYKKRVKVNVTTHHGPLVAWQVQLYTFQGKLLGQTKRKRALNHSKTVRVDLKFPIQPGKFTIVIKGYPRGCHAESELADVVRFADCTTKLPVRFPDRPGGAAADYEGFLSVPIESRNGALIKNPETEVYSTSGEFFGRNIDGYKRLFGRLTFNNKLTKSLRAGQYTVILYGRLDQPRECGPKQASTVLTFS
jgi:hypothetical protein